MLYDLWLRIIGGTNVDNVLKNFHRAIAKLERARDWHNRNIQRQANAIKRAQDARDASDKASMHAENAATKMKAIVGL